MSWILAIGLAAAAFLVAVFAFRLPRAAGTTVLAALALGLAGYAWQGNPGLPGAPREAAPLAPGEGRAMVEMRRAILPQGPANSRLLITADAMAQRDRYAEAATLLRGAVQENPRDSESWLALGNVLVAAAQGQLTPAARLAYRRAEELAPDSPGVPFFLGVAQLTAGNLPDTAGLWRAAAQRLPEGSEQRGQIEARIERLEAVMRQIIAQQGQQVPPPAGN